VSAAPLFSVVTPTRDRPHLLRRALEHLLAQSVRDWEALVIDDGDGSGSRLAASFGDERVRTAANAGAGQVDARNTALALARGRLVCWLDDDDWWEDEEHLAQLVDAPRDSFFFRGGWIVFEDGAEERREIFDLDATPSSLRRDSTILTSSVAYPRSAHRRVGLFDRELGSYWDWDFLLRLVDGGFTPRKLAGLGVCYSAHDANTSSDLDSDERREMFRRFTTKHGLETTMKNHVLILHELSGNRNAGRG
jgi:glycosyltransferase involved in cell wall biosynthesis